MPPPMAPPQPNPSAGQFKAEALDDSALRAEFDAAIAAGIDPFELFLAERSKTVNARAETVKRRWLLRQVRASYAKSLDALEAALQREKGTK
jgi:hypothetical protein